VAEAPRGEETPELNTIGKASINIEYMAYNIHKLKYFEKQIWYCSKLLCLRLGGRVPFDEVTEL
jgi:hypothetical protein